MELPLDRIPSPAYVVNLGELKKNLEILKSIQNRSGAKIILALKGFAMFSVFPLIRQYLPGVTSSSFNETLLGSEEFGGEVHVYAPAYRDSEIDELLKRASHITFNSFSQWNRFKSKAIAAADSVQFGLRINPEYSEAPVDLYNPCAPCSRFGMKISQFEGEDLEGLSGLHFHTLCEQGSDALERTLDRVLDKFGPILKQMSWINFGGGHHITKAGYDTDLLCRLIKKVQDEFDLEVYLEPGEAVALNTGVLVGSVLDIFTNGKELALLDLSATAHMPDVLEMPYRPVIQGAGNPNEKAHTYRLGGLTCLAGDVVGDYSFDQPLEVGSKLVFMDMAHYTMVKNTTFNGVDLPSIVTYDPETDVVKVERKFGYADYRDRLS